MITVKRKRSPRAPSISLSDAVEKVCRIYELERCHAAPADGVAQHLGYKDAGNGAALSTLASLKYYGLLERPKEGTVVVSKDVERFLFAPSEKIKQDLKTQWLKSPQIFAELLDKYTEALPSDATIKFELIQRGFGPDAADLCLQVFRRSVEFAGYFEQGHAAEIEAPANDTDDQGRGAEQLQTIATPLQSTAISAPSVANTRITGDNNTDRIPIRLAGGRRAWIEIPIPFYVADRERLKKQIDLLLTDDDEELDGQ